MAVRCKLALLAATVLVGCSDGGLDGVDGGPVADPWAVRATCESNPIYVE